MTVGDRWFFDRIAPVYDLAMPGTDPDAIEAAFEFADGAVDRVFDVGGGTGRAVRPLEAQCRIVLDPSLPMLGHVPAAIGPVAGTADRLPFSNDAADAVLIIDALHHIPRREAAIQEATRILRPGGVLVIRDFDPTTARGHLLQFGEHIVGMRSSFRTPDSIADQLAAAGFEIAIPDRGFAYTVVGRKPTDAVTSDHETHG